MTQNLKSIIGEYIADFKEKQNLPFVVKPSVPIVWFGDREKYEASPKRVLTVALNPSRKEFEGSRFDIVDLDSDFADEKLSKTLCEYFKRNPYSWFRDFEKVLSTVGASYYENRAENTAIHIDIYSAVATDPTWGKLSDSQRSGIRRTDLFKKLLEILNPDVIIVSANQTVFREVFYQFRCVKSEEDIGGKIGFFIRKYKCGEKILISGRNLRGQPFGGMSDFEIDCAMKNILQETD